MCQEYKNIIDKQLKKETVESARLKFESGYYMPDRSLIRTDKVVSHVRLILDASCKQENSKLLNYLLIFNPILNLNIWMLYLNLGNMTLHFSAHK